MSRRGLTDPKIQKLIPSRLNSFIAISRAGNLSNQKEMFEGKLKIKTKNGALMCSAAPQLNHSVLLPNGDVVLCCMDYSIKHKVGNLLEQEYSEIFSSKEMQEIHNMMSKNSQSDDLLCRKCEYAREILVNKK